MTDFNLQRYLANGVEDIVKTALKSSLSNPKESVFLAKYAASATVAQRKRDAAEAAGRHIPPFLIASITSSCNLHCAGCYSRANAACSDLPPVEQLSTEDWAAIFRQARDMGIGFILLAGGEPLLREDVLRAAAEIPQIVFPVFTNATLLDAEYARLFDAHRNLVPVISVEGPEEATDHRRGAGIFQSTMGAMELLQSKKVLFGASVTVTTENLRQVAGSDFLDGLRLRGCQVVIFVEFVPVVPETAQLAPGDAERAWLDEQLAQLRAKHDDMLFISFPGDEGASGGCLAAGRGFFHINSHGGAEPCPFSPYSDVNVRDAGLAAALDSPLFTGIVGQGMLETEHTGGCVLFQARSQVEELLKS